MKEHLTRQNQARLMMREARLKLRKGLSALRRVFLVSRKRSLCRERLFLIAGETCILARGQPTRRQERRPDAMRHRLASKPLPLNHIPSDPARVALLVAVARAETDMLQRTLASSLHVSERTVQRLERGESPPAGHVCQKLVEVLSGATDETWNALVEALELPLEPPPASLAPPPDPPPAAAVSARIASSTTTHASFDDFLRAQADDLDVPASRLRAALEALLGELEARGLSFAQAREILAGARLGFGRGRKGRKF